MLIDTHAHLYLPEFEPDRAEMIQRAMDSKVEKIVLPNIDLKSMASVFELHQLYPSLCWPAIGLHPCDVKPEYRAVLAQMEEQLGRSAIIAIGETGTDAYWDTSYWTEQVDAFSIQIGWAKSTGKPIIIHSRESLDQNIDLISKHQDGRLKGIFHCFTGTVAQGRAIIDLGFHLGIGGVMSYKNSDLKTVLAEIGPDALVLETDAPFLPPVPHRGKRNEPSYLSIINRQLAGLFSLTEEDMARITTTNARRLFNFI